MEPIFDFLLDHFLSTFGGYFGAKVRSKGQPKNGGEAERGGRGGKKGWEGRRRGGEWRKGAGEGCEKINHPELHGRILIFFKEKEYSLLTSESKGTGPGIQKQAVLCQV